MDGYTERILHVDLTARTVTSTVLPEKWKRDYFGGRGLGVRILVDSISPDTDPLSPDNCLIIAAGPLTGSGMPLCSRFSVVAKSPLSGTCSSANSGGAFGVVMKRAGIDALVVTGRSQTPAWLFVDDGIAEIHDAAPYWGMGTRETTISVQADIGDDDVRIACIGPAGEHCVRIAAIVNETGRAAGRGGLGAVMGAKRLKAIAVRGKEKTQAFSDPDRVKHTRAAMREKIERNGLARGGLHRYGTAVLVHVANEHCILPTRNFQENWFERADLVSGEEMSHTILEGREGCYGCPVACGRITNTGGSRGGGPEYETIWAFGPACGVDCLPAIARAGHLCNDLGLDTISTGSTIACAMELSERGYIPEDIRFGDGEMLAELVQQIGHRVGIGDRLAEGSYRFASRYGHPELSMSVKGLEMPGYDPRGLLGQGLEYATSVRGGCHVYGNMLYPEVLGVPEKLDPSVATGKARMVKHMQDLAAALDSAGICLFSERALTGDDYAAMISAVTGLEIDAPGVLHNGERIWNLQKLFNLAAGFTRKDDNLPRRMRHEPLKRGPYAGQVWKRQPMLDEYYRERGWNRRGIPTKRKLKSLDLIAGA